MSSAGVGATGQERWMQRDFSALSRKLAKCSLPEAVSSGQHMAKGKKKERKKVMEKRDRNILRILAFAKLQKESVDNLGFQA